MKTQCNEKQMEFRRLGGRKVVADFAGGQIASDGGALLLGKLDEQMGLLSRFASCFKDYRDAEPTPP
jgi:hypothetical protein